MTDRHPTIALDGFPTLMTDLLTQHLTHDGVSVVAMGSTPLPSCIVRWLDGHSHELVIADHPVAPTIVVTDTPAAARRSRRSHVVAITARDLDIESFVRLVKATASGEKALPSKNQGSAPATDRELEVMELVADGQRTDEIAAALGISPHTVRTHIQHVISRLGVSSRAAAVVRLADEGLIGPHGGGRR